MFQKKNESNNINQPRLLVVSTNAVRRGGSNGRLLAELLNKWPAEKLAQFYTHSEYPDFDICKTFYRITDNEAFRAFLTGKKVGCEIKAAPDLKEAGQSVVASQRKPPKNALTLLLRDIVWNSWRWLSKDFWHWVDEFRPEAVLVLAGASAYPHNTAIKIANRCKIPLIVLNTENYYLKDYNYLKANGWNLFYPLYKWECDCGFRRLMRRSSLEIYINKQLSEDYDKAFGRPGEVIYHCSLQEAMPIPANKMPIFSYAGNLGIDRHKALIQLADTLQRISPSFILDVYGRALSESVEHELRQSPGIAFHGMVPYDEVIQVMRNSDFMVHAESFDPFWIKDLRTAFSTKIADILKSGKCLILYAAPSFACTKYVQDNDCGCVITTPEIMESKLRELISNKELQLHFIKNALIAARRDMDGTTNSLRFMQLVTDVVNKTETNEKV